jgi:cation diffusion facilitator CzcD-associated flavoprotein CzcO
MTLIQAIASLLLTVVQDYQEPLRAEIPGISNFNPAAVIHPQFWPKDLDYTGKKIVIIGSGATAITLLPALAEKAESVTQLQRSPSYVLSQPREDGIEWFIRRWAPASWVPSLIRYKWLAVPWLVVNFCRVWPRAAKSLFRAGTIAQLPPSIKQDPNFEPAYNPFEQRMCFCPDGDYYKALRSGKAHVVTGQIDGVTSSSIRLVDGQELHPDLIVTATGLKLHLSGGVQLSVDNQPYSIGGKHIWKNIMLQDLPNAAYTIGYVDASWTLGADATAKLVCRILKKMQKERKTTIVAKVEDQNMKRLQYLNLSSTYVSRASDVLPVAGDKPQWRGRTSYFKDIWEAWFGDISTGVVYG